MDKELELQYRVHAALDVVEEKCQPISKATPESKELYLGMLYSTETHKMCVFFFFLICLNKYVILSFLSLFSYGFVTNTKIKFVIVVDSGNIALRENEVRAVSV